MEFNRQWFESVDRMYKEKFSHFLAIANRHIFNRDYAIDAVHDAFAKAVEYNTKNPTRKLRPQILDFLIIKACKKLNKYSKEISTDFSTEKYDYNDIPGN